MLSSSHNYDNCVDGLAVLYRLCKQHVQFLAIHSRLLVDRNTYDIFRSYPSDAFQMKDQ